MKQRAATERPPVRVLTPEQRQGWIKDLRSGDLTPDQIHCVYMNLTSTYGPATSDEIRKEVEK